MLLFLFTICNCEFFYFNFTDFPDELFRDSFIVILCFSNKLFILSLYTLSFKMLVFSFHLPGPLFDFSKSR